MTSDNLIQNPLVSAILPSYNHERYIKESIESILNQTYKNLELIIIDDASTDNSQEIIRHYQEFDDRIRCIFHTKNKGIEITMREAIKDAKGKYIAVIASDDMWMNNKIEKQIEVFNHNPNIGLVYTDAYTIDSNGVVIGKSGDTFHRGMIYEKLLLKNFISGLTVMFTKEAYNSVGGYDINTHGYGDYDLWLQISKCYKIDFTDEPLAKYRMHQSNISHNLDLKYEKLIYIFKKELKYNKGYKLQTKIECRLFNIYLEYIKYLINNRFYRKIFFVSYHMMIFCGLHPGVICKKLKKSVKSKFFVKKLCTVP